MSQVTLQQDIQGLERALRHLIGEDRAIRSRTARLEATLRLERARLAALLRSEKLTVGSRFFDVSNWQPNVDLKVAHSQGGQVRVGGLLVTKLTEGETFVDSRGLARVKLAKTVGFGQVGAYAFLHPSQSGAAQAQHLLTALAGEKPDVIIADLEVSDGAGAVAVKRVAHDFAVTIRKQHKGALWLYGGGPFLREFGVPLDGYDAHWLAAYVGNPAPFMVYGRARTIAWQFTDGKYGPRPHVCPGIGACDMSIVL